KEGDKERVSGSEKRWRPARGAAQIFCIALVYTGNLRNKSPAGRQGFTPGNFAISETGAGQGRPGRSAVEAPPRARDLDTLDTFSVGERRIAVTFFANEGWEASAPRSRAGSPYSPRREPAAGLVGVGPGASEADEAAHSTPSRFCIDVPH